MHYYMLAWDDGTPITVIGVDGGLLEHPEQHGFVMLAPGKRLELWMDFSGRAVDTELTLHSISFDSSTHGGGMHGMMMAMPHPMHLHGEQFQIVKREVNSRSQENFQTVVAGFINNGWKDVVLGIPGEKVTILKPFNDFKGMFMVHCHNLEHENISIKPDLLVK